MAKIYKTTVSVNRLPGFLSFLKNLGVPTANVNYTLRGGYYLCSINLANVEKVVDVWHALNNTQLHFMH